MATDKAQLPPATPQANRRGCLAIGAITAGRMFVHLIALVVVCHVLCSGFPVAWRLFVKEEMRVPALTAQTYSTYHWMVHYWFLAIPAMLVVDGLILAGWSHSAIPTAGWRGSGLRLCWCSRSSTWDS